jgi:hypothetical protein
LKGEDKYFIFNGEKGNRKTRAMETDIIYKTKVLLRKENRSYGKR